MADPCNCQACEDYRKAHGKEPDFPQRQLSKKEVIADLTGRLEGARYALDVACRNLGKIQLDLQGANERIAELEAGTVELGCELNTQRRRSERLQFLLQQWWARGTLEMADKPLYEQTTEALRMGGES